MDALRIEGGAKLSGHIEVSGSKNATLPIMAACLLTGGRCILRGVPALADVHTFAEVLRKMGATVEILGATVHIDTTGARKHEALYDIVRTMRASILVLGPLLARFGKAKVSLPGGCAIGARPIEQHLKGLGALGAHFDLEHGYVLGETQKGRLAGAEVRFDFPTVGGTENVMLAAALAKGTTTLYNAAREPEIVDLANVLELIGARIEGAGSSKIIIEGTDNPKPFEYQVVPDRIEFGTFLVAGALAGQDLHIIGGIPEHQKPLIDKLTDMGTHFEWQHQGKVVSVTAPDRLQPTQISTEPYPGFPTDMQAQLMTAMALADGRSEVTENIFENRFMHVAELQRLGADIHVDGGRAKIKGVASLSGTTVMATDLRASASLVLAGLVAAGTTTIRRIYHLDRGYESIGKKLGAVGANIERFKED